MQDAVARDLVKHIAAHLDPGKAVVQINAVYPVALEHRRDVVQVVVPDLVATRPPVASGIDGAGVAGLLADVMQFVQLDEVLVATIKDSGMGSRVDQVVTRPLPGSVQADRRIVHVLEVSKIVDVAVFDVVLSGGERLAIAA